MFPPQPVETEPPGDGEEPRQQGSLGVEPIEVDEGPDERLPGKVLGVRGPMHAAAGTIDRAVKAQHELVEGRRVSPAGPPRQIE